MKKSRRINKRKNHTRRFRARLRSKTRKNNHKIWIMKGGGLRAKDCINIGIDYAYRFNNPSETPNIYTNLLREYMFGTRLQEKAWMDLLRLCLEKAIPVYILTSGNKVGIIRMLQLTVIDRYITEVLCTHPDVSVNPINTSGTHNFHRKDKYEVIQTIVRELKLPELSNAANPIGYFLDDDEGNFEHRDMCSSIRPMFVLSVRKDEHDDDVPRVPDDFDGKKLKSNEIYKLTVEHLRITPIDDHIPDFNFTPISIIKEVFEAVKGGTIRILFLDFDKTLQIHNMAISFHQIDEVLTHFFKKNIRINELAHLP